MMGKLIDALTVLYTAVFIIGCVLFFLGISWKLALLIIVAAIFIFWISTTRY